MLKITYKWWPLTTLNRWPLYLIKIYSKMHRESTKVTVMSRWPLYKGDRYDRFDCKWAIFIEDLPRLLPTKFQFIWKSGFRNQPIRNKNCLWWPCLLTDWEEISNLYKGSSIDVSYQVLAHLAKHFQRRPFRNQPIRNKNCLRQPCLLTDWDEMSNLYRGPSIDASYQVAVHLGK